MKYKITLTENQVNYIIKAIDNYKRLEIGQFETPIKNTKLFHDNVLKKFSHEAFDSIISELKGLFDIPLNGNHGIYHPVVSQDARECHAIQQVLSGEKNAFLIDSEEPIVKIEEIT